MNTNYRNKSYCVLHGGVISSKGSALNLFRGVSLKVTNNSNRHFDL